MFSHTADVILRIAAWTFVPDFATRAIVRYLFPSQATNRDFYRRTFAAVIAGYLLYNVYVASTTTPPNFYQILRVPVDADENTLKTAFRVFARKNHPDRAGPRAEALFIQVRDAYDGLRHPIKRFAYDRFGPDIFGWESCGTPRECVNSGLLGSIGFYIASTFFMGVTWLFGARDSGAFWRYVLFFGLFVAELALVLAPSPRSLLATLFPDRVPFQHVQYIHQLFLSVSIAIQRIYPALLPDLVDAQELSREVDPELLAAATAHLAVFARNVESETKRMVVSDLRTLHIAAGLHDPRTDFTPSALSDAILATLREGLENLIVDRSLRSHSLLRARWDGSVARMRSRQRDEDADADVDEDDEVDVSQDVEGGESAQLPSPPSSEQPESPRDVTPKKTHANGGGGLLPKFERGAFGELNASLKSSLGLGFPGTPGAGLRGRSGSV